MDGFIFWIENNGMAGELR